MYIQAGRPQAQPPAPERVAKARRPAKAKRKQMAKVEVFNGDLESALASFKRSSEGAVVAYKKRLAFTSPAEQRRKEARLADLKYRSKERRRKMRQEQNRRKGKDD